MCSHTYFSKVLLIILTASIPSIPSSACTIFHSSIPNKSKYTSISVKSKNAHPPLLPVSCKRLTPIGSNIHFHKNIPPKTYNGKNGKLAGPKGKVTENTPNIT